MSESECSICLQVCVLPSKLPCGHTFCFLCIKGLTNLKCAMCRADFPCEFFVRPELLTPINPNASTSASGNQEYKWFYGGYCGWWQYDERTCQEIENEFQKGEKHCSISVAGNTYVVDFKQMLQIGPNRTRQVKRDLATTLIKGVAGVRLSDSDQSDAVDLTLDDSDE